VRKENGIYKLYWNNGQLSEEVNYIYGKKLYISLIYYTFIFYFLFFYFFIFLFFYIKIKIF
jgi:hypothetical protein